MGVTKSIVVVIICISLLMVTAIAAFPISSLPLSNVGVGFNNKSTFKIAMFADLHFGENAWEAWGPAQDMNSTAVMSKLLDQESPDFVVFLGDVITANNLPNHDATKHWQHALAPTVDRMIPWASLFGNHDDAAFEPSLSRFALSEKEANTYGSGSETGSNLMSPSQTTTRMELMEFDMSLPNSASRAGPRTLWPSVSNYAIPIAASSSESDKPAAIMYFLDSGGGSMPQLISAKQALWFTATASEINPDVSIPEIVFWHIPSTAYVEAGPGANQPINVPCVGSINDENVAPQEVERGIMESLSNRSSVKAVFVGHNHGLDWCCPYENLHLCFARHTGYGGYGTWTRGTRLLEVVKEPTLQIRTWVKLEDGTIISELLLS